MKYKTEMDCYLAWYDRMVKVIADRYDCEIRYPNDVTDVNNMTDGLKLRFNRLDWGCCLTNFCVYHIFDEDGHNRHTSTFNKIRNHLEYLLLSEIRK